MPDAHPPLLVRVALPGVKLGLLTYLPPRGLTTAGSDWWAGRRVRVPLGTRKLVGVSIDTTPTPPPHQLRRVAEVLDNDAPLLPPPLMRLARWISDYYLAEPGDTLRALLPAGLLDPPRRRIRWIGPEMEGQWPPEIVNDNAVVHAARLLAGKRSLAIGALRRTLPRLPVAATLLRLEEAGLIIVEDQDARRLETAHTDEIVLLNDGVSPDDLPSNATAQRRVISTLLASNGELPWPELKDAANVQRTVLSTLEDAGRVRVERRSRDVIGLGFDPRAETGEPPELVPDQHAAAVQFIAALDSTQPRAFLLDGLPGTGKTRAYLEAVNRARHAGKGVIVLVPEISLTPQVIARLRRVVDEPVAVLHSGMNDTERLGAWREIRAGRVRVVVGPRSAIFAPVRDLGLIVVDEEHEEAYKQQDPAPRYHGRDVALMRGRMENAVVILTSATPSLEAVALALDRKLDRLRLTQRFGAPWPAITVIDRRREAPDQPYIGHELARAIETRGHKGEGVILLITRRGYAPVLQCDSCGHSPGCPNCDIPLTFHTRTSSGSRALRCHLCGHAERVLDACPECQSQDLHALGAGTQRVEEEVQERFPSLAPARMDRDSMRSAGEQERVLRAFAEGDSQILLGTQLVAKGHDFENVTLVGVVNADPSLHQPDFRASERAFRLLVQAAGRAGRGGETPGEVLIQTLRGDHPLFTFLKGPHLDAFAADELQRRRQFLYPPASRMIRLTTAGSERDAVRRSANALADMLGMVDPGLPILGPEPALVARVKRAYRYHILIRTARADDPSGKRLRAAARAALSKVEPESGVAYQVDVDPIEVL